MAERRHWWRVAQVLLAVLVVGLAIRKLAANWGLVRAQAIHWEIRPLWLLVSVAIVWLAYAMLVEGWRRVVIAMLGRRGTIPVVRFSTLPGDI